VKTKTMTASAILCVDDEPLILESLKEQLKRRFRDRYVYEMAESASEAWEVIQDLYSGDVSVILIVSDWLMPGIKGDEFLTQVHQKFPNVVTIMLTGQADETAVERAKNDANLYACIAKPWAEEELTQIITSALG
jgi:CheY-like chemotaxis protein